MENTETVTTVDSALRSTSARPMASRAPIAIATAGMPMARPKSDQNASLDDGVASFAIADGGLSRETVDDRNRDCACDESRHGRDTDEAR